MYLKIQSKGEVAKEALSLMGASTKRNDGDKIGMFGTGNKYALATLLRNNIDVRIYSGKELLKIEQEPVMLGGHQFSRLIIGGEKTSITTALGKDWEVWMAVRELYSNAIDEGLKVFGVRKSYPNGNEGDTTVYIGMNDAMMDFWVNRNDYFAFDRESLWENEVGRILPKFSPKLKVFRKGILANERELYSVYDYDLESLSVGEDRLAKYNFQVMEGITKLIYNCENEYLVRKYIDAMNSNTEYYEFSDVGWFTSNGFDISDTWKKLMKGKKVCPISLKEWVSEEEKLKTMFLSERFYTDLNVAMGEDLKKPESLNQVSNGIVYEPHKMLKDEEIMFAEAMDFFKKSDFEIPYKIEVVEFKNGKNSLYGMATKGKILLGQRNFTRGLHEIINTIIEEFIHLKYDVADETRGFQTAVIDEMVTFMKKNISK